MKAPGIRIVTLRGVSARTVGRAHPLPVSPKRPAVSSAAPVRLPGVAGATPAAIEEAFRRLVVVLAIDDSGSTFVSDPRGVRYAAARAVAEWMRRQGGGRVGVAHWGTEAPASLAVGPVSVNRQMRKLGRALKRRPDLGGTVPAAALHRATQMLSALGPDDVPAVLLLTDGEERGPGLEEALSLLPEHSVHLLVVGDGDQHAGWESLPFASIARLPNFHDQAALAVEISSLLARTLGLHLRPMPTGP